MSNVQSTKKTPQIRFKGFSEEWTQKKYTETFDTSVSNNTFSRAELTTEKTSTQNVHYGDILIKYNSVLDVKNEDIPYIPEDVKIDSKNLLKNGDIVFADTAEDETCGKATEINNIDNEKLVAGLHTFVARPKTKFKSQYLGYFVNSPAYHNQLLPFMQGTKVTSISKISIQKTLINFPSATEQNKIGSIFSQIDSLIASTQKEHDKLVTLKKCMLQKMFPKKGSLIPEIRFKGFSGDWEEKKLGEITEQTADFTDPSKSDIELWSLTIKDGLTPKTDRYIRDFLVLKDDNYKKIQPGEIVYNPMNMPLGAVGFNTSDKAVAVSGYYVTMRTKNCDAPYLKTWMKTKQALNLYKASATGSLLEKQRVQYPTFSEIRTLFPSIPEQKKIGSYFQNLDNLISKQASELDKLKNIKKTLLSKMFI